MYYDRSGKIMKFCTKGLANPGLNTKLTIPPEVKSQQVDDETVLLDLASGMYFGLDVVGRRIWELITQGKNLGEAASVITAEYEVEEALAQRDVIEFVRDLVDRGLLTDGRG